MFHYRLIIAPREVLREIKNGNDELVEWAGEYENNFLEPTDEEYMSVQDILSRYPENIIIKYNFRPWLTLLLLLVQNIIVYPLSSMRQTIQINLKFHQLQRRIIYNAFV